MKKEGKKMKYYCLGIKGTGMSTLAQILHDLGHTVSGYDDAKEYKFTQKGLEERNIKIYYDNTHDLDKDTTVTYSVAVKEDNKEFQRVKEMGLNIKKYNEIMGEITKMFDTISVAGTHGKTTTSSLTKHILSHTTGCNYFIGAGDGYADKKNKLFVIESDEFNKHFITYYPKYSVITNIEEEHMECYKDLKDIISTFEIFASNTKEEIIACGDNENIRKLKTKIPIIYYGFNEHNEYQIKNEQIIENGENFDLYQNEKLIGNFTVPLYGKHMVLDTTAAIIICLKHNIEITKIKELLLTFRNAKRRFVEEKIENSIIIDDYAHHPTEIKVTLEAIKAKYPKKRIVAVFKPNTYSRTKDFKNEFIESLKIADKVYLTEIDCNREKQEDYKGITSHTIIDQIENAEIISEDTIDKLSSEKESVVCFMSCAYVNHLIEGYKNLFHK